MIDNILQVSGRAGSTFLETSTDVAKTLDDTSLVFKDSKDRLITSLLIQIQDNELRFCFDAIPIVSGLGMILYLGQHIYLTNPANIRSFTYISNISGSHVSMMITPFYGGY